MTELLYDRTAGVHATKHPSLVRSILCESICTPIGILCHRFHTYDKLMGCVRCAAARNLCEFIFDIVVTPMEVTTHSIHFPLLYFIPDLCVYMFCSYSAGSVEKRGVGKLSYSVVTTRSNSVYSIHRYSSTKLRVTCTMNCYTDDIPPLINNEKIVTVFISNLLFEFSDML
jgi:hypothetical protein